MILYTGLSTRINQMHKYTLTLVEDDADVRDRLSALITEHEQFELLDACGTMAQGLSA